MRVDANGNELRQRTVWLPAEVLQLIQVDGLNLSAFVRQQLEILYSGEATIEALNQRVRLVEAARESMAHQRRIDAEREAERERARDSVRLLRAERDQARARRDGVADALLQIVGDGNPGDFSRVLPENDPHGDRIGDWEALVRRVSRLCGAEVDSAGVADGLKKLIAAARR